MIYHKCFNSPHTQQEKREEVEEENAVKRQCILISLTYRTNHLVLFHFYFWCIIGIYCRMSMATAMILMMNKTKQQEERNPVAISTVQANIDRNADIIDTRIASFHNIAQ